MSEYPPEKRYFAYEFMPDDVVYQSNQDLAEEILRYKPATVFEFGCGLGKMLNLIKEEGRKQGLNIDASGIDVNQRAVDAAVSMGRQAVFGDEATLTEMTTEGYDVVLTCSVLDHISDITSVVEELKRMAVKAVVCLETNTFENATYFPHDYESLGFVKKEDYLYHSTPGDNADYEIWTWTKPS